MCPYIYTDIPKCCILVDNECMCKECGLFGQNPLQYVIASIHPADYLYLLYAILSNLVFCSIISAKTLHYVLPHDCPAARNVDKLQYSGSSLKYLRFKCKLNSIETRSFSGRWRYQYSVQKMFYIYTFLTSHKISVCK